MKVVVVMQTMGKAGCGCCFLFRRQAGQGRQGR